MLAPTSHRAAVRAKPMRLTEAVRRSARTSMVMRRRFMMGVAVGGWWGSARFAAGE